MSRKPKRVNGRFVADPERVDDTATVGDGAGSDSGNTEAVAATDVDPGTVAGNSEPIGDDHRTDNLDGGGPEQPARRGRGRPRGSGNKDKTLPLNVKGIERLLVGIHGGLALLLSSPSFALDTEQKLFDGKTEAEFLAQSVADVSKHYNPKIFDQKTADWFNLIQCAALIYGPRIYNVRADRRAANARPVNPARPAGPKPVDPMPQAQRAANGHATPVPANNYAPSSEKDILTGEIPGVGNVTFPSDFFGKAN